MCCAELERPVTENGVMNFNLTVYNYYRNIVFRENIAADMLRVSFDGFARHFDDFFLQKYIKHSVTSTQPKW